VTVLTAIAAVTAGLTLAAPATAAVDVPAAPSVASMVDTATAALAATAPERNDGLTEPIYWVHGIDWKGSASADCAQWDTAISRYRSLGAKGDQRTVAFYTEDEHCNTRIGDFPNHSGNLPDIGKALAWDIYHRYTEKNISVDAVGHSMGGLIIRAAITGVQKKLAGWPPRLYVEDVVTLSTPHTGSKLATLCGGQCNDLVPGSSFLKWLSRDPQSTQGTDWTLIGASDDDSVDWSSAVATNAKSAGWMSAGHKVVFGSHQGIEHSAIYRKASTAAVYRLRYWNYYQNQWIYQTTGASPVIVARNAGYYWHDW
jgi:putative serine esterase DUF676